MILDRVIKYLIKWLIGWQRALQALPHGGVDHFASVSTPRWHRVFIP
jgi:hypothetical protein